MKKQILILLTITTIGFAKDSITKNTESTQKQTITKQTDNNNFVQNVSKALSLLFLLALTENPKNQILTELKAECKNKQEIKELKEALKELISEHKLDLTHEQIKKLNKIAAKL